MHDASCNKYSNEPATTSQDLNNHGSRFSGLMAVVLPHSQTKYETCEETVAKVTMTYIYNSTQRTGVVPSQWLAAIITPIS
jgi:hypothetical protein